MEGYINEDGLWTNGCVNVEEGKTPFSEKTFACNSNEYAGCLYRIDGRCVFNVATIKIHISRVCYEDIIEDCD